MSSSENHSSSSSSEHHHHHHHSSSSSSSSESSSSKKSGNKLAKHSFRTPLGHLFGSCLTTAVFLVIFLLALFLSLFNTSNIVKIATSESLLNQIYEYQLETAVSWAADFNLPKKIFNNVVTSESIAEHMQVYVEQTIAGEDVSLDTSKMQKLLTENIYSELKSSKIEITDAKKQSIESFVGYYLQLYQYNMSIKYLKYYHNFKLPFIIGFIIAEVLLLLLIPINILFISSTHKNSHKVSRQVSYGFLASGAMSLFFPLLLMGSGVYKTLTTDSEVVYNFYMSYFNSLIYTWASLSLIPITIGIVFIIITKKRKHKLRVRV